MQGVSALGNLQQAAQASAQDTKPAVNSQDMQKLKKAASEFEAMLLSSWWSAMKESGLSSGDDSFDAGHDTLDQLGMQAMSSAVASGGGIGLGAMLVHGLLSNTGLGQPSGESK